MSRENVELLRRGYDALWRRGDWEAAFAGLDPDIEWLTPAAVEGGASKGRDAVIEWFRNWLEPWEDHHVDYTFTELDDERVLVDCHLKALGRESGAEVEMRVAQVWTIRDGRAVRMELFPSREDALQAVGRKAAR